MKSLLVLLIIVKACAANNVLITTNSEIKPIVIWHGMGKMTKSNFLGYVVKHL